MARALAYARTAQPRFEELLRACVVTFCGLALAMAGGIAPF